jgi:hypothetical protein
MTQTRMEQPFRLYRERREAAIQGGYFFGGARMPHSFLLGAALAEAVGNGGHSGFSTNHGFSRASCYGAK